MILYLRGTVERKVGISAQENARMGLIPKMATNCPPRYESGPKLSPEETIT
jgi:hypothetical protein